MATGNYQKYRRYFAYIQPILADPIVRSYFGLVASLILITFLILFALSPTINIILGLRKKISDQQNTLAALTAKVGALVAARAVYSEIEPKLIFLDRALPLEPQPQDLIRDLHASATASGVMVAGLQFKTIPLYPVPSPTISPGLPAVGFCLALPAPASKVREFLGKTEARLRYARIQSLSFSWSAAEAGMAAVNVSAKGYYAGSQ